MGRGATPFLRQIEQYEHHQREGYEEDTRTSAKAQSHMNAVTYYQDPRRIEEEIGKVKEIVGQTPGIDDNQKATELGIRRSGIYAGVIERYLANDQVAQADRYFQQIKDRIGGDKVADIERALLSSKQRQEAERQTKLTELRQSLSDQLRDTDAAAEMGIPIKQVPQKHLLQLAFGEQEGAQRYETAQTMAKLSTDVQALHGLTATELRDKISSYTPTEVEGAAEKAKLERFIRGRIEYVIAARKDDPAGYLARFSPSVQKAWNAFQEGGSDESRATYLKTVRAERERLQIPKDDVLPNGYIEHIANQINSADAQKLATIMEREGQKWGADWPAVQGQLAGKISDTAAVISSGIPRGAAVQLAATARLEKGQLEALLPPGEIWSGEGGIQGDVQAKFRSFARTFPSDAGAIINAFMDSGTRLTAQYMHQGMSRGNAVEKAYRDLVRDSIVEFRSAPFRVPPDQDRDRIELGARHAIENLNSAELKVIANGAFTEEEYQGQLGEYVREYGYWVTRPDAKGLRLYVDGGPVGGHGGPIEYTWAEVDALGNRTPDEQARLEAVLRASKVK